MNTFGIIKKTVLAVFAMALYLAIFTSCEKDETMEKKIIYTEKAPMPIGPYYQAVEVNGTLYLSGQIGIDATVGDLVQSSAEDQYRQVFKNIGYVLEAAGYSYSDVVKSTVFILDMNNFSLFNTIYAEYFHEPYPARSVVEVSALPKGALVEMEVVAAK